MAPPNASRRVLLIAGITILCLAFLANLWTILVFPSWFDEAFFANISFNLYRGMGRTLDLIPDYFAGSVNTYGPLYFDLQSILIRINGLHAWIFRLPNLASGYLAIAILYCVLRLHNVNKPIALLFGLACSLDVSVNRVLVSGRMDFLSVFFVSAALLMVSIRSTRLNMRLIFFLSAGFLSSMAFLTTPRSLFLLPAVAVVGIHCLLRADNRKHLKSHSFILATTGIVSFALPIAIWIYSIGGLSAYISLFASNETIRSHVSPSFFRSFYDNISIILMLCLVALNVKLLRSSSLLLGLVLTYLLFSMFVKEVGPYAGMITPFVLMIIFYIASVRKLNLLLATSIALLLTAPGAILVLIRTGDLIANQSCRYPRAVVNSVKQQIASSDTKGLNIVAPFKYYFELAPLVEMLTTVEYAQRDASLIYSDADIIFDTPESIIKNGLTNKFVEKQPKSSCKPYRLPFLTNQFLSRSTYREAVYTRAFQ